jgi:hypothetical protein
MKNLFLVLMAVFSVSLYAETVSKLSAPFQFPTAVGVISGHSMQSKDVSFSYHLHSGNRSVIGLSWALPEKAEKGSISVFSLSGTKIKTIPISGNHARVNWDISGSTKLANGVYLATLTSGSYKKNLQILISR